MCPDDEFGWNSHTNVKEWKIVGRKEMLVGRHTDITKHTREKAASAWSGSQLERVNAYVLEIKEKDPDGIYSKEIFYVDPETWRCFQKIAWDRQGKVWRMFFYHTQLIKSPQGIEQPHCCEMYSCDLQKKNGSSLFHKVKEIGQQIPDNYWTIQNLQKLGY
jgi:hypothetical protein